MPIKHTPQDIWMGFVDPYDPALHKDPDLFPTKALNPFKITHDYLQKGIDLVNVSPTNSVVIQSER